MPPAVTARRRRGRSARRRCLRARRRPGHRWAQGGPGGPDGDGSRPARRSPWRCTFLPGGGPSRTPRRGGPPSWPPPAGRSSGLGRRPSSVVGVGCTAQWSGTVAVDAAGTPLRPAVIWMDSRGSAAMRRQMRGPVSVHGLRRAQAPALDPAHRRGPQPLGQGPHRPHPVDPRHRARRLRGHLQVPRARRLAEPAPHGPVLGLLRLDRGALGHRQPAHRRRRLRRSRCCGCRGSSAPSFPTSSPPPPSWDRCDPRRPKSSACRPASRWPPGPGDVHSAAVGSGAVADFAGHLYIGTSSWISCHVPFKKTDAMRNVASIPAAIPGRYLVADEHETAGACLTFLAENVLFDATDAPVLARRRRQCLPALRRGGGHGGTGVARGHVHAVAQRGALPGRRPHHPGRVPQPVALDVT